MSDKEDWEDADASADEQSEEKLTAKKKRKAKAGPKKKTNSTKAELLKTCFVCDERSKSHSKFCRAHEKTAEAIKYQARTAVPSEIKHVEEVLADES